MFHVVENPKYMSFLLICNSAVRIRSNTNKEESDKLHYLNTILLLGKKEKPETVF